MIILDTHIWVWWVHGDPHLAQTQIDLIQKNESEGLGVSVISCWEVAKLVELKRLVLPCLLEKWIEQALAYPGVRLLPLTPKIVVHSTKLPGIFHRDPADQMIVATAREYDSILLTSDAKIRAYTHIKTS